MVIRKNLATLRSQMEILVSDIPEEGLHLEGSFPKKIFALDPKDSIRAVGDVSYEVDIFSLEEMLAFAGQLRGEFELQCGLCLEYFPYQANFSMWSSELDLEDGQRAFDLSEVVREDTLLLLPSHPRCDEFGATDCCPRAHLLIEGEQEPIEEVAEKEKADDTWSALDDWQEKGGSQ